MIETKHKPITVCLGPKIGREESWMRNPPRCGHISRITAVDRDGHTQLRIDEKKPGSKYKPGIPLRISSLLRSPDGRLLTVVWHSVDETVGTHSFDLAQTRVYLKVNLDPLDTKPS